MHCDGLHHVYLRAVLCVSAVCRACCARMHAVLCAMCAVFVPGLDPPSVCSEQRARGGGAPPPIPWSGRECGQLRRQDGCTLRGEKQNTEEINVKHDKLWLTRSISIQAGTSH